MSKYFEIDAQSKFRIPKNDELTGGITGLITDIGRLMYSEATERLYLRGFSTWIEVSTPYDILDQGTKILFGSYPLPIGWQMDETSFNDKIVLLDTNISQIGDTGGSWTITGINAAGSHNHNFTNYATLSTELDYGQFVVSSVYHGHDTSTQSNHTHSHTPGWRPYNVKYCIGEYDYIPPSFTIEKIANASKVSNFQMSLPAGATIYVDWGDGSGVDQLDGPVDNSNYFYHSYSDTNAYTAEMTGDLDAITVFTATYYPMGFDIAEFTQMTALYHLQLNALPDVTGELSDINGMTTLTSLYLHGGFGATGSGIGVTGDIADLAPLTNLTYLYLDDAGDTNYTYTQGTLPDWDLCEIHIADLDLSEQEIDDFLCDLNTASTSSVEDIRIKPGNALPSVIGEGCQTALEGKGWVFWA